MKIKEDRQEINTHITVHHKDHTHTWTFKQDTVWITSNGVVVRHLIVDEYSNTRTKELIIRGEDIIHICSL